MFPIGWLIVVIFLLIWSAIGSVIGFFIGLLLRRILHKGNPKIVADLLLGAVGSLAGVFISGWASQRTFNSGVKRSLFIWDEMGQAIDWRTALADSQSLLAVVGTIVLVTGWHLAAAAYKSRNENNLS